jgi:hypothetical protein
MSEQPVDDPVREASSRLVQGASLAAMAAEALSQARQSRAAARTAAAARAAAAEGVQQAVAQAAARVAWAPLLQRGLRAHLTDNDVAQARAAADLWSPGVWEAQRAREHAQRRQAATHAIQPGLFRAEPHRTATARTLPAGPGSSSPTTPSDFPPLTAGRDGGSTVAAATTSTGAPSVAPTVLRAPDGSAPALATAGFPEPLTGTVLTRSGAVVQHADSTAGPGAVARTPNLHRSNGLTR